MCRVNRFLSFFSFFGSKDLTAAAVWCTMCVCAYKGGGKRFDLKCKSRTPVVNSWKKYQNWKGRRKSFNYFFFFLFLVKKKKSSSCCGRLVWLESHPDADFQLIFTLPYMLAGNPVHLFFRKSSLWPLPFIFTKATVAIWARIYTVDVYNKCDDSVPFLSTPTCTCPDTERKGRGSNFTAVPYLHWCGASTPIGVNFFFFLCFWHCPFDGGVFFFQVFYALCHYNSPPTNFVCVCEVVCRHLTLIEKSTPPSPLTLYTHTHTLNVSKDNFLFFRKMHITKVWSFISSLGNYSCALCLNCRVILSTEKMFHEKATQFILEKKKWGGGERVFCTLVGNKHWAMTLFTPYLIWKSE